MGCELGSSSDAQPNIDELERVTQTLVAAPFLPAHEQVAEGGPRVVEVRMVIEEKLIEVGPDGAKIWAMTFDGSVPGPLIVVHEDDYVELTLVNPESNTLPHNIDFHAATGALGGAGLTLVAPGQEVKLRFRATKAGVFVYHCAPGGTMIPWHVVSGMNGAIMVLPRDGLKDARESRSPTIEPTMWVSRTTTCQVTRKATTRSTPLRLRGLPTCRRSCRLLRQPTWSSTARWAR